MSMAIPKRYIFQSLWQILVLCIIAYGLLILVFAIEKAEFILNTAIENKMQIAGFLTLLISIVLQIADYIIPITTVVALYFMILQKRERREFLIFASAGIGLRPLMMMTGLTALVVAGFSLYVSGYLKPAASFTFRYAYAKAFAQVVADGPESGRFFRDADKVVYVSRSNASDTRNLRVFDFDDIRLNRIFISDCSNLKVVSGNLLSNACGARIYSFNRLPWVQNAAAQASSEDCRICPDADGRLDVSVVEAGESTISFNMSELFEPVVRDRSEEMDFGELLESRNGRFVSQNRARRAIIKILIALSAVLSATAAILAVAATSNRTRFFAIPIAIALSMLCVVAAGSGALIPAMAYTVSGFVVFISLSALACVATIPLSVAVARRQLTRPGLARS